MLINVIYIIFIEVKIDIEVLFIWCWDLIFMFDKFGIVLVKLEVLFICGFNDYIMYCINNE